MRAPLNTHSLDFSLKQLILSADVGAKVQAGDIRLVVVPFQEQPRLDHAGLAELGLSEANGQALVAAARQAYRVGVIDSSISPIEPGSAFDLLQLTPSLKPVRFGTGIVLRMAINRLDLLTARQWHASGHQSQAAFLDYWAQVMPDSPTNPAPWCWLIHFDFKE
ncbi:hypothetical protein [Pseudomonas sp. PNPG3]|uniref:hypothetical protein n=1 Tax=Pseudomonas sp. PNPG3 TaxID=2919497 RepID=UPI001FFCED2F|nr:hypothetical protein [Pseudomonas sp. PNPG3]MCK2122144.1 hypothetical protein [Pseudomonas sp. PNPG3]